MSSRPEHIPPLYDSFALYGSGVTLVAVRDVPGDQDRFFIAASVLTSSVNPFTIALSVGQDRDALPLITAGAPWAVSVLSVHHLPLVRLLTARPALRSGDPRYGAPAWTYNALGGLAAAVDPGMFVASETLALTALDLIEDPALLAKCQAEFKERTGGGIGGDKWVAPLLPADFQSPHDLPWPQYVTTPHGEEWWMPQPVGGLGTEV